MWSDAVPDVLEPYLGPPDARSSKWFLTNSMLYIILTIPLYFLVIKSCKQFMRNRKPFDLKYALLAYNAFQALFSLYVFSTVALTAMQLNYKLICQHIDLERNAPQEYRVSGQSWVYVTVVFASMALLQMATGFWLYHLSKYIDLLDTVFFVLRKKDNQISFLHCYHHSSMLIASYSIAVFHPGGHSFFVLLGNSLVHVIMYSYYFLSALGPVVQPYLWWKKYLTQIQLLQFTAMISQLMVGLCRDECAGPYWLALTITVYISTMIPLFLNFYLKNYNKTSENAQVASSNKVQGTQNEVKAKVT